ncbi:MAG: hypothetical protein QXS68_07260 [Candidatus Methanomethylicaceae archaeon]
MCENWVAIPSRRRGISAQEQPTRLSTNAAGVAQYLGLRAEVEVKLEWIMKILQARLSDAKRFALAWLVVVVSGTARW